ncbi:ABC-type branched-subunit amino acid transport system substrate-binding protein [Bradyrhizobium sp. LM4.3]
MTNRRALITTTAALAFAFSVSQAFVSQAHAQKKYDTGATDTEIKIGQTVPFSGAYSVYANIGKTQAAYFKMINDQGGINGRKINLIQYDDAYSPPKTVEQVRKLVEGDEVLFTFQIIGTAANAAVQKYLNGKKIPQLLASTGAARLQRSPELSLDHRLQSQLRVRGTHLRKVHSQGASECQDRRALSERRHGPRLSRGPEERAR